MKFTVREISVADFFAQLTKYQEQIQPFLNGSSLELQKVTSFTDKIKKNVNKHIIKHISPKPSILLSSLEWSFYWDKRPFFHYEDPEKNHSKEVAQALYFLEEFSKDLDLTINYLSAIDSIKPPEYSTSVEGIIEKNDYVLNKLKFLFGDPFYSVSMIFRINGIKYRKGETREICEDLKRRGYVILEEQYGEKDDVKISVKGASYIERKNKQLKKERKTNNLDKKLDHIIEHLTKLGYGQEIIFNEIEELRELQHKLSKKSWSQLLKGKLLDLALDKIVSKEAASFVFEYLTNNDFKLLH